MTNPIGGVTEYTYDANNQMLTVKNPRGFTHVTNEYDVDGRIYRQTQADGGVWVYSYTEDANGNVIRTDVTDPRGYVTRYVFNAVGYFGGGSLVSKTRAYGTGIAQTVTYERNASTNFVSAVVDSLARRSEVSYDSFGNATQVTQLAGTGGAVSVSMTYDSVFQLPLTVTDALSHTMTLGYDAKGNVISMRDALNNTVAVAYNTVGQPVSVTPPGLAATTLEYANGLPTAAVNALGHRVTRAYDALGRVISVTDPLGNTARMEYDGLGRVVKSYDPLNALTQMAYDANSNVSSLTDARGGVTSYAYDSMDRRVTRTDPRSKNETAEYHKLGGVTKRTDRKTQVTNVTYDSLGRVTVVTFHDASTISLTYDAGNRLTQVVDSLNGTFTYTYDLFDRVLSESGPKGSVSYGYDAAGRRTSMTVAGQTAVTYSYDNANRLTGITRGALSVAFAYDAAGRQTSMTLPNSVVAAFSYDAASRLTGISWSRSGVAVGNLIYEYDAVGRKTRVGGSMARTGLPAAVGSVSYDSANRMTSWGGVSATYDDNGNLTGDGTRTYSWNARNQMASISGGSTASFQYDHAGRRMQKTVGGTTTGYLYDGANIVQEQGGSSANLLTGFGYDQWYSRTDGSGTLTPLTDSLNSTVAMSDSAGVLGAQYTYEPFGSATVSGSSTTSQQYTGREADGTGLMYYRARYYSPGMQRFVSEDPLGFGGGDINLYVYVGNASTQYIDPSGEIKFTAQQLMVGLNFAVDMGGFVGSATNLLAQMASGDEVSAREAEIALLLGMLGALLGAFTMFNPVRGSGALQFSHTFSRPELRSIGLADEMPLFQFMRGPAFGNYVPQWFHALTDHQATPHLRFSLFGNTRRGLIPTRLGRAVFRAPMWFYGATGGGLLAHYVDSLLCGGDGEN